MTPGSTGSDDRPSANPAVECTGQMGPASRTQANQSHSTLGGNKNQCKVLCLCLKKKINNSSAAYVKKMGVVLGFSPTPMHRKSTCSFLWMPFTACVYRRFSQDCACECVCVLVNMCNAHAGVFVGVGVHVRARVCLVDNYGISVFCFEHFSLQNSHGQALLWYFPGGDLWTPGMNLSQLAD